MASLALLFLLVSLLAFYPASSAMTPYAIEYWEMHVSNELPKPEFLLRKASPLTPVESAQFALLIDHNQLSAHLPDFCNKANLVCFQDTGDHADHSQGHDDSINVRYNIRYRPRPINIRYRIHYRAQHQDTRIIYGSRRHYGAQHQDELSSVNTAHRGAKANDKNLHLFFREAMLKPNTIMPMPDINDDMPERSFLPRPIVSKFPFTSSKVNEIKKIFGMGEKDTTIAESLKDCEREGNPDETRKCAASIEDMIDFATSILGEKVLVHTMETSKGSNGNIMLGEVKKINGGKLTNAVSCHELMFPYLLYYCHSIPRVRVYEADILDPVSKAKINHGVAICHVDTSSWSQGHESFVELGSSPGKIEVCHWIFRSGIIWTTAD